MSLFILKGYLGDLLTGVCCAFLALSKKIYRHKIGIFNICYRGWAISTPASYSGDFKFKSRPGELLHYFFFFSSLGRGETESTSYVGH
jgi:hypothetical protein